MGGMSRSKRGVSPQPLIAVRDVLRSTRWYCSLLGLQPLGESVEDTHGNVYNRLFLDEQLVLQLHAWEDEEHPNLMDENDSQHGHGVLLWFAVEDFDAVVARARKLKAEVVEEPHVNAAARHHEMWLRDPDGYLVVVASPDGEARV